jgi:hypothetical protein
VPFPSTLDNFTQRRIALSLHALGGAIALLAGRCNSSRVFVKAVGIVIAY